MHIVQKLLFILGITFTCALFAMEDEHKKASRPQFYEGFYPGETIKTKNPIFLLSEKKKNILKNNNFDIASNFHPVYNYKEYIQYADDIKKCLFNLVYYEITTNIDNTSNILELRDVEDKIIDEYKKYGQKDENIIEEDIAIKNSKIARYKEIYKKDVKNIITRPIHNTNDMDRLNRLVIHSKNIDIKELKNFKKELLSRSYDEITLENDEVKVGLILDLEEDAVTAKTKSTDSNVILHQKQPIWKDERFYTMFVVGAASTLGLLKLYNWFRPNQ